MNNLGGFFNKIEKLLRDNDKTFRNYRDVINKIVNISDEEYKISVSGNIVNIKTNPIIKNEILLKKNEILEELNKSELKVKILEIK